MAATSSAAAGRQRPVGGARHQGIEVALVPHVDGARGARAQRDRQHGEERLERMDVPRRDHHADQAGEDHERHHARLQEIDVVA